MGASALQLISPEYRDLNRELLRLDAGYGNGGAKHADTVVEFAIQLNAWSILDYGCGRGKLRQALRKTVLQVQDYDPAIPAKAKAPKPADLVVCTDVLEHVEPASVPDVLRHIRSLSRKGAYLSIATRPSNKTLPDGRNAHLSVHRASWWMKELRRLPWQIVRYHLAYRKHTDDLRGIQIWLKVV